MREEAIVGDDQDLRAFARNLPQQDGVKIGAWLEKYAAAVPSESAIVEVGCWLGAGTAHLALGAMESGAAIHVYDRWRATQLEIVKAAIYGVKLQHLEDTLPRVKNSLARFPVQIHYYQGDVREAKWSGGPIGLYVDDATKVEPLWSRAMTVFQPHFIPGKTILVLMDYYFFEKAGPQYAAQKSWMEKHGEFELIEERMKGSASAVFRCT